MWFGRHRRERQPRHGLTSPSGALLNLNIGLGLLVVYHKGKALVLDNQIKDVADAERIKHYRVMYSLNEKQAWRHNY